MTSGNIVPQEEISGQTVIDDQVIGSIANTAAQEVEGVSSLGSGSVRRILSERLVFPNAWEELNGGHGV